MKITKTIFVSSLILFLLGIGGISLVEQGNALSWGDLFGPPISDENPYCQAGMNCSVNASLQDIPGQIHGPATEVNMIEYILGWVRFLLQFVLLIAIIMIIIAGVMFMTSFGNESQNKKAKTIIIWTLIGIVVILLSWAIVSWIISVIQ